MASTRNKNMSGDYYLEQQLSKQIQDNRLYEYRRVSYKDAIPCAGINIGSMPNTQLAHNAIDIESNLYGINSTNLVNKQNTLVPKLKTLPSVSFFERHQIFIPEPLVIENGQRPLKP